MSSAFERLQREIKQLPGLGYRSAERIALHVLVEKPERLKGLVEALKEAESAVGRCQQCGNLAEEDLCVVCNDEGRRKEIVCIVEQVQDLIAIERSESYKGVYHVLHGKLSPIHGVGPDQLNFASLEKRLTEDKVGELILALSNDVEGEATCHYITEKLVSGKDIKISRIGFGLPSGGGVLYADPITLKSALEGRRDYS
jgi:recombination protein RecR